MIRSRLLGLSVLAILAILVVPSAAHSNEVRPRSVVQVMRAAGTYTIPAAWAGVWTSADSTYDCTTRAFIETDFTTDTLCTGQTFQPDTSTGITYDCSGPGITDTQVDVTCVASFTVLTCTVTYTQTTHATRVGDTATAITTVQTTYTPPMCLFQPDSCHEIHSVLTRVEPAQPACATPARQATWGSLKVKYR